MMSSLNVGNEPFLIYLFNIGAEKIISGSYINRNFVV